jgi:uncharacterized repeat protein (TIGR03803 family)
LVLSGNTLYGTANGGGIFQYGTVFSVDTTGIGFTVLHTFTGGSDGSFPRGGLVLSGNTLYGTAINGGANGSGTVFSVDTTGTGFTVLHTFTRLNCNTNLDGANPYAGLVLSDNMLYGTAFYGGTNRGGTVFSINTNGTGFTVLHTFTALNSNINLDGANPYAGLVLSGNSLHGTACYGGSNGDGTAFSVNTNGSGFIVLYTFTGPDGSFPQAGFALSGRMLYGTAYQGGTNGYGTVFSLFIPPQLTIIPSRANVVLTWPTNAAGFTLQSTTNLVSPAVWTTVSPGPVVVNGQDTVTNPISGTQQFYRLSQ